MSATKLVLVPIANEYKVVPAAMHELAASRYLGMNRTAFRQLVFSGQIAWTVHISGVRRIYLKSDLDHYLEGLPRRTMAPRENSARPALKGVGQ